MTAPTVFLSFGAGVQSSVMLMLAIRGEIGEGVSVEVVASPEPNFALVVLGVVARIFEAIPREFEEDAVLRIHQLGLIGKDSEELGVEAGLPAASEENGA
jgi:hypothetical protein